MRAPLTWSSRAFVHRALQVAVDTGLVAAAWWLAFYFRFDGDVPGRYERLFAGTVLIVVVLKMATFAAMRFYTKWWRFTSLRDLQAIVLATAASSLLVTALLSSWRPDDLVPVPRGVLVIDLMLTLVLVGGARFAVRSVIERPQSRAELIATGREVLICGAGDAGVTLLREMKRNRELGYNPVGLIDDDPRKRRLRVQGTRVRGTRHDLSRVLREIHVDEVIIAMPSAPGLVRQEIVQVCRAAGVPCTTLPGLPELITGEVTVSQLREVRVEDVLGRAPVEIDFARMARYLNGRSVLVTGAGGSIGRELCRQVATIGARRLVLVDHAENNLFEIDMELRERGHAGLLVPVIADCKDPVSMERLFQAERPDVVFHAAAYKHVPMMELNPLQAVANNALGTEVVARLAERHGVDRFCLISTDKAVEPQTVMGASKALAERIVEAHGGDGGHALRGRPVRQRPGLVRLGAADLPAADRGGRPGHGHPRRDDPLLHDDPRGGAAGDRRDRHRRGRRHLRAGHGRAGPDHRPRPPHDRAVRPRAGPRHRDRGGGHPPRREAPRGALQRGRGGPSHQVRQDHARHPAGARHRGVRHGARPAVPARLRRRSAARRRRAVVRIARRQGPGDGRRRPRGTHIHDRVGAPMTVITRTNADRRRLPEGAAPVAEWGLLSRVHRDCPEHGGECHCVGRHEENGLVFWCDREGHHFSTR